MPTYHLRRSEREIADQAELEAILARGKFITIALCRDNEPYVVTLSYGYAREERALYFHCALEGQKLDFVRANPQVCATVIQDEGYRMGECAHAYRSVVLRGMLQPVQGLAAKEHGMQVLLAHLEEDPERVRARQLPNERAYERFEILRLDVREMSGKCGS